MGIQAIDANGKFDPDFHQAIGSEVSAEHESGDIMKECFKGFKMGDKVIRYSQVIVNKSRHQQNFSSSFSTFFS